MFLSLGGYKNKLDLLDSVKQLGSLGLKIFATEHTYDFLRENGIKNTRVYKISEAKFPSVLDLLKNGEIDLAINISENGLIRIETDGFIIRRTCVDLGIPLITNLQATEILVSALVSKRIEDLEIKSWDEYLS